MGQRNPHSCLWKGYQKHRTWDARRILCWYKDSEPVREVPHMMCFLADESPLVDEKLSTAEMTTVMWLSFANYLDPNYEAHHIIPVCSSPFLQPRVKRQVFGTLSNCEMLGHRILRVEEEDPCGPGYR